MLQITILSRRQEDELLLLASDGLWDVLTNQEACSLAKRCLRRARQRGATRHSAARIAATVLTRAAVDRGSRDNVTVVVVDLSSGELAMRLGQPHIWWHSRRHSDSERVGTTPVGGPDKAHVMHVGRPACHWMGSRWLCWGQHNRLSLGGNGC